MSHILEDAGFRYAAAMSDRSNGLNLPIFCFWTQSHVAARSAEESNLPLTSLLLMRLDIGRDPTRPDLALE
jgi:hypothetical protein